MPKRKRTTKTVTVIVRPILPDMAEVTRETRVPAVFGIGWTTGEESIEVIETREGKLTATARFTDLGEVESFAAGAALLLKHDTGTAHEIIRKRTVKGRMILRFRPAPPKVAVWILHYGKHGGEKYMSTRDMQGCVVGRSGSWRASVLDEFAPDGQTSHEFRKLRDTKRWEIDRLDARS